MSERISEGEAIDMMEFYPFETDSDWGYEWSTNRGDKWRGEMKVTKITGEDIHVYDIENVSNNLLARSMYKWDSKGLYHFYKILPNDDSLAFNPPRVVIPSQISIKMPVRSSYNYSIYSTDGALRRSGSVSQTQQLVKGENLSVTNGVWENCAVIKTTRLDTDSSGETIEKNFAVWYAAGVGPVKIVNNIPSDSAELTGSTIGMIYTATPEQ